MPFRIEAFGLSNEDANSLVRGVALGEYSLLLGAGFSLGARNGHGVELPTSRELAQELKDKFALSLPVAAASDLPIAYEDAVYKAQEPAVSDFLRRRLTGCVPSWQGVLSNFAWSRIWTLNIDDLLEEVFRARTTGVFDFRDRYHVRKPDELQMIHLHGRANRSGKKIFSIQEYHDAVRGEGFWHTAFFSEYKERPVIACGASLVGEVDLARTFRAKNESGITRGLPSIAVVKDLASDAAERLKDRLGLLPVAAAGGDFFLALASDVESFVEANPTLLAANVDPNLARRFGQQFRQLELDNPGRVLPRQDFYSGDEPLWADIVAAKDATLSFAKDTVRTLRAGIESGVVAIGIFGDAGCGKSSTLLRVAREMSPTPVFLFRGEDDVDIEACLECVGDRPAVLLFDNAADVTVAIGRMIQGAKLRGKKLGVVIAERGKRKRGMLPSFGGAEGIFTIDHSRLTPGDAVAVVERRKTAKRLGAFGATPVAELRKMILTKHHGSLLSSLAEIDIGHGFDSRLKELNPLLQVESGVRDLLFAVAQTHRWGYPLPIHFATVSSGVSSEQIVQLCAEDGSLADVLFIESRGIRYRHRILAERVFDRTKDHEVMAAVAKALVAAISPVVNPEAIRAKSYAHRICKVLMERRSVYATLGGNIDKARQWYADVEEYFGWNARFWEQRALLELEAHNFSAAYSFSRAAVDKEDHAFPLTTFGTICLIIAGHRSEVSLTEAFELYCEGEAALQNAMVVGRRQPETLIRPIATFFTHAERFWPVFQKRDEMRERLVVNWQDWIHSAESVGYFRAYPEVESEIRAWLLRTAIRSK